MTEVQCNGNASPLISNSLNPNDSHRSWVVQKFGGTSVGKFAVNIAEDIVRASLKDHRIAVVCSARSTGKKVEGTTSRLLEIYSVLQSVNSAKDSDSDSYKSLISKYEELVDVIRDDHISAAKSHIQDEAIVSKLADDIRAECKEILEYRLAVERWHLEIDSRSKDRLVSFGEKLSCKFVAALLQDRGVDAEYLDLSDAIHFKTPKGMNFEFYKDVAAAIKEKDRRLPG
ncbi:hypothetical protein DID88_008269 [Monilinia fructigena]|uniref:Aspartate/glutamate/uridylate kinase domain-containing protein n=1 Tax=Monilinia fructigena TaxID=38457 RepID=A0A395J5W6_9HELO|nr:hypothetical protein DID88_008269 [Monilinia fructigena]